MHMRYGCKPFAGVFPDSRSIAYAVAACKDASSLSLRNIGDHDGRVNSPSSMKGRFTLPPSFTPILNSPGKIIGVSVWESIVTIRGGSHLAFAKRRDDSRHGKLNRLSWPHPLAEPSPRDATVHRISFLRMFHRFIDPVRGGRCSDKFGGDLFDRLVVERVDQDCSSSLSMARNRSVPGSRVTVCDGYSRANVWLCFNSG